MKAAFVLTAWLVVFSAPRQERGVTVRLSSTTAGDPLKVLAKGGGGTLRYAGGEPVATTDTINLGPPVTLHFYPDSGAALFEVVGDSARVRADVVGASGLPAIRAEAQRLLVHRAGGRLEVRGVLPNFKLGDPIDDR